MRICTYIVKASEMIGKPRYKSFNSYEELLNYMKKTYDEWVIRFLEKPKYNYEKHIIKKITENLGKCDEYLYLIIYDDFIE